MSLEGSYTSEIVVPRTQMVSYQGNLKESPCLKILRRAMEKVAAERGGNLDQTYTDNEGGTIKALLSVRTRDFPRGVGAFIEKDGRVTFRYDAYGDNRGTGQAICDAINQHYNVIAVMQALNRHGFNIRTDQKTAAGNRRIVTVTGVR